MPLHRPAAESFEALIHQADALSDAGRYASAVPLLTRALALDPDNALPYCHLARAYLCLRQADEALTHAQRAVALEPESVWPHELHALCFAALRQSRESLEAAQTALRLDPQSASALHILSTCQYHAGMYQEARWTAERLREVAPEWPTTYELLARSAATFGKWSETEVHCRRALELDPENHYAMHLLGEALLQLGFRRGATEAFREALRIDPSSESSRQELIDLVWGDMSQLPPHQRKARLAEEHESVRAFINMELRRPKPREKVDLEERWLNAAWVAIVLWTLVILGFTLPPQPSRRWWEWTAYVALILVTVWRARLRQARSD